MVDYKPFDEVEIPEKAKEAVHMANERVQEAGVLAKTAAHLLLTSNATLWETIRAAIPELEDFNMEYSDERGIIRVLYKLKGRSDANPLA